MASTTPTQERNNGSKKPSSRRRKKRRTEDFSSSSESSSSDSEPEQESDQDEEVDVTKDGVAQVDASAIDIDIDSDPEQAKGDQRNNAPKDLTNDQKRQLQSIPFTTTSLSQVTNPNTAVAMRNIPNIAEVGKSIDASKQEIGAKFLKIMTQEFDDDLDELRKKPDFTDKSLISLAKTLQSGVNMFDYDTVMALFQAQSEAEIEK
ncbi:uncharacterized protein LODBEIA_P26150 [Lodderomyces beijingensis]|uniref:Ribosome assembly protein 3 n=1 Tax=Lodderomyces beijingensis TaxID=1775926 RepID=A0ABP0ZMP3_9ASCO